METLPLVIEQREAALEEFDRQVEDGARVNDAVRAAADLAGVSLATIYNWLIARGVAGADRPAALTPQYHATAKPADCHPEALDRFLKMLRHPSRPSLATCYRLMRAEAARRGWLPIPSERAMRRRIAALPTALARAELKQLN